MDLLKSGEFEAGWESGEIESAAHGIMPELQSSLFQSTGVSDKLHKIPALCLSVFSMKVKTDMHFSSTNPERVSEVGCGGARWCYYHSASVNGHGCTCFLKFGGEKRVERQRVMLAANNSLEGCKLQTYIASDFSE